MAEGKAWRPYLSEFHADRAGITERILERSGDEGDEPYGWMSERIPSEGVVLDVACGSAPLAPRIGPERYIGVDLSTEELRLAAGRGAGGLVIADATRLPFGDGSVDAVVCSMALQVLTPLPEALAEASRVLRRGGVFTAMYPVSGPLSGWDAVFALRLLWSLRSRIGAPNEGPLRRPAALVRSVGLRLRAVESRCFHFPLNTRADIGAYMDSLYVPSVGRERYRRARSAMERSSWFGYAPVPLVRLSAVKED
ncbi:class I SAM-dependent methyltransferase [Salininema proteolyticum]|uniref:Class I SAM-dependent methyltransferase n=1 Tax=Salininema proteolyticum TaxID=1607685 RepID=A0ABV8TS74_9ACTN